MTREDTKERIFLHDNIRSMQAVSMREVDTVLLLRKDVLREVDKIYDDFESMVCKNCKYYKMNESVPFDGMECTVNDSGQSIVCFPPPTFGCNKFKRKDDK